jgi:hypothetical protein
VTRSEQADLVALGLCALALAACVPLVDEDGRGCRCQKPYTCCERTGLCVRVEDFDIRSCASRPARDASPDQAGEDDAGQPRDSGIDAGPGDAEDGGGEVDPTNDAGRDASTVETEPCSAQPRISNVLVLIYSPVLQSGLDLQTHMGAHDARALSAQLAARLRAASGGLLNYEIVEVRIVHAWPPQLPGSMVLDERSFFGGASEPPRGPHGNADYGAIFEDQRICEVVVEKDISELWLWGSVWQGVDFGFDVFSYVLSGDLPSSATSAEADDYAARRRNMPRCADRTLWIQSGFYSVHALDWHIRNYNFRVEKTLPWALRAHADDPVAATARWSEFSSFERDETPGPANIGLAMFPPNAGVDDDGGVPTEDYQDRDDVLSGANLWAAYPYAHGGPKTIDCSSWGCSSDGFQQWFAQHLPRNAGISPNGTCNSWWRYFSDADGRLARCPEAGCGARRGLGLPCVGDEECASGHCVCQAGSPRWAACSATPGPACGRPDWTPCQQNADCVSARCGCLDGSGPKICLPDAVESAECNLHAPPAGSTILGGLELTDQCRREHGPSAEAILTQPPQSPDAVHAWVCHVAGYDYDIDEHRYCQGQYDDSNARAAFTNADNAYAWYCYSSD